MMKMDEATEELFFDLMEMPSSEQLAALEAMESIPDELKTDLRRMLKEAAEAGRYFTRAADAVRALPASRQMEKEGEMCGPCRLVRILGEGGFGVVWQAEQEHPIRRVVALKVIKAGMDTKEVIARFDAEKQALARMAHPNIAKVLDAGMTGSGRPFFVMARFGVGERAKALEQQARLVEFCEKLRSSIRAAPQGHLGNEAICGWPAGRQRAGRCRCDRKHRRVGK